MKSAFAAIAAAGMAVAFVSGTTVAQTARTEVGVLNCAVAGGAGFVFGSSKVLDCTFQSGGRRERYHGSIDKFGIDIGVTGASVISWAVFAPTSNLGRGALAGNYGGATGEATVGVGLGANVLVGGSKQTIALQPLSVGAQQGLNIAVGVASLKLRRG